MHSIGTGSQGLTTNIKQLKASKGKHIESFTVKLNRTGTDDLARKDFGGRLHSILL